MKKLKKQNLKEIKGGKSFAPTCIQRCEIAYRRCQADKESCRTEYQECLAACYS
jgi:hypothetical protein